MNCRRLNPVAAALWAVTAWAASAQPEDIPVLSPLPEGFSEMYQGQIRLSPGAVVFGIEFDDQGAAFNAGALYVHLAKSYDGNLCIKIDSIDGDYWAEIRYDLSGFEQGTHRLKFETSYSEELSQYSADQIAILATVRQYCEGPAKAVVLTSLAPSPPSDIALYLGSGDYTLSVELPLLEGDKIAFTCGNVGDTENHRIFDVKCVLPVNERFDYSETLLKRTKLADPNPPQPIRLPLDLPE